MWCISLQCRYTLQYTYPYAYYLGKGARKDWFESQQAQLEAEVENLSWKLERAEKTDRGVSCLKPWHVWCSSWLEYWVHVVFFYVFFRISNIRWTSQKSVVSVWCETFKSTKKAKIQARYHLEQPPNCCSRGCLSVLCSSVICGCILSRHFVLCFLWFFCSSFHITALIQPSFLRYFSFKLLSFRMLVTDQVCILSDARILLPI